MAISGEYYLVTLGSIVLSNDGTGAGAACLTKVDNLDQLFSAYEGATQIPLSGKPFGFVREISGNNVRLLTKPFVVTNSVLEDIRDALDAAFIAGTGIAVKIEQGPGAVNVDCDPLWEDGKGPITFSGNFFNEDLYDVEIRLITRGFTAGP